VGVAYERLDRRGEGGQRGGGNAGDILPTVPTGTPGYEQIYPLCTTGGPVTITSVTPVGATGPASIQWGVHHGLYTGVDAGNGPLGKMPGFAHRAVTEKCGQGDAGLYAYLGLSMTASKGAVGVQWFKVNYNGGPAHVPFSFETCPGKVCPPLLKNHRG
jgi:hypothetical protein